MSALSSDHWREVGIKCRHKRPETRANPHLRYGLKIPRRKACRFDSGPGHQWFDDSNH